MILVAVEVVAVAGKHAVNPGQILKAKSTMTKSRVLTPLMKQIHTPVVIVNQTAENAVLTRLLIIMK